MRSSNRNTMYGTDDKLVSVIVTTHNRCDLLKCAIESVLNQTYGNIELIVVDDNSSDNTQELTRSLKEKIIYMRHNKCLGGAAARMTGSKKASGEYIAFLDDDDQWTPNKLEKQLPVIEKSPPEVGLVYAWMEYFENGKSRGLRAPELRGDVFVEMLDKQAIGGCPTIIIKREVIDKIGFFDESLPRGNDGNYWRRIAKHYSVDFIPKVLAIIHIGHDDRISVVSRTNLRNAILAFEKRLQVFSKDFDKYPRQKATVLAKLGTTYLQTGQTKKGLYCLGNMLRCNVGWLHKCELLYRTARGLAGFIFRNLLHPKRTQTF